MASSWILGLYFLIFQIFEIHCQGNGQPEVIGNYRAIGEMAERVEVFEGQAQIPIHVAFEENYDKVNSMSTFSIWEAGKMETFVENFRTGKTFQYIGNSVCKLVEKKDWIDIDAPPSLMGFESDKKIRFALQKLLTVDKEHLKSTSKNEIYRGLPANMWLYEIKGKEGNLNSTITIYAYWSISTWDTTGGRKKSVPLGYKITKILSSKIPETHTQNINVFAFIEGSINKTAFEAREGVQCEGAVDSEFPFPKLPQMQAVSIHSEIALASYLEVKNVDIWYDMKNKLLRMDMDTIRNQEVEYMTPGRKMTFEYTSKELGVTFRNNIYKGKMTCQVIKLDNYDFDAQDIINPKLDGKYWDMDHFFGVNDTKYIYIGQTVKRNIPCHVFQGLRTDWPEKSSKTKSLWEWCFAVNLTAGENPIVFRDKELPLVSAQIYFIESFDIDFPNGSRLVHHFYDSLIEDPSVMYATAFDISRCFEWSRRAQLQFTVDAVITSDNVHIFENATSDPSFLQQWRDEIYKATKLTIGSLRVARVKSAIYNRIMYITFTLLDVHPQFPDASKQKSLADARKDLNATIDSGNVQIKYTYEKGKSLDLKAKPKTLGLQVDPTTMVHDQLTEKPPITKVTTPSSEETSTVSATATTKKMDISGSGPGTVAGVSIAMVIVGISLGAGGTFYKYRGLPMCCRRA